MDGEIVTGTALAIGLGLLVSAAMWAVKVFAGQTRDERVRLVVGTFVEAAEQMFDAEEGEKKLSWVMGELQRMFPKLDTGLLRAMVEQAVLSIRLYAEGQNAPPVLPVPSILVRGAELMSGGLAPVDGPMVVAPSATAGVMGTPAQPPKRTRGGHGTGSVA